MLLTFNKYCYGYKVASVAKNESLLQDFLQQHLNVLLIHERKIKLYPDNIVLDLSHKDEEKLKFVSNHDVIEIFEDGRAGQIFRSDSPDNAIIITDKCNSNCVMCPVSEGIRKNGHTKSLASLEEIVRHIPTFSEHITITGGEPFLLGKDVFKLLAALKERLPETGYLLLTNGRAFSIADFVKRLKCTSPNNMIIAVPIHGYNAETHDAITQAQGSFEQTYYGLKNIIKAGFEVELRIVVSKLNSSFLNEIANLIIKEFKNAFCVKFIGLEMLGNAAINKDNVWIPYSEAFIKIKEAVDLLISNCIDVGIYNFPLCTVSPEYRALCHKSITDYKIRYEDKCKECIRRDACGGIFSGTIRLVDDLRPFKE